MFKEMVKELFELSMETMEAKAYVSISLAKDYMNIGILDAGWDRGRDYDGFYTLHDYKEFSTDNRKNFEAAKEHLERLIKKGEENK
ncbi:MAG: hypothetical protein Q4C77_10385 [Eubacteriales bacterium]|nr:hypothetical protein [Eubacteriales bacterium]